MKHPTMRLEVVEYIPEQLEQGILYASFRFATATHLCPCGCRREIATPLSPADWTLKFDGEVSLSPSVGNWSLPCRSHYFVRRGKIVEAGAWSPELIEAGRAADASARRAHYGAAAQPEQHSIENTEPVWRTWLRHLTDW